ncbi:MAG: hypothetical protein ACD_52C00276G0003 [uncultured bacterium]|uniref:Phage holin family protein n=1 Tax=Candidatus Woesebacteria bacterium RIFCSPHIGHO2_12_FULL_41_24 TaxID=1802510 RepID=A0A1F8AR34_9BACT|nr:MAG: hypothetical protein ACD_52C00276G0003 [uncultured bacterium]OGM13341.1 MAG: hypothetical protein A2W15_05560 [Candidatus Woesebacteria bacterium RBG_16_41_13]OGM30915.1 MAG: hypothetical protein A2873_03875 [Candidatus Woesebacteria bacterium RIFCSPHIGHO2_01_FULL_42_80]OGM35884.1 MAG: hypothetical protein A3D84_01345 [Candidatus Woesebacteria bacterium RIFCSPHIGHO2_02_FULL_42_20]OGM54223.1 MAG: hypothetical protein A3E44_00910 [Candidatus Woesebacteria bacterium RIFCSPHIGHO2_12_FULL_41
MKLLIKLATNVFALYIVASIVPGVIIRDLWSAVVAAVIIGVINTFLRPILQILALPVTILTFGVFAFLINVSLLYLAASIVDGFVITNFASAVVASIALFFISWFLHKLGEEKK